MADLTTIKFLSLTGLTQYDAKIKAFVESKVSEGDANSFKFVNLVDGVLKFYTENPITEGSVPAYEITLPVQDLSHLMELVEGATAGNVAVFGENGQVVDGEVALADLATKAEVEAVDEKADANAADIEELQVKVQALEEGTYDDTEVRGLIQANADAIAEHLEVDHDFAKADEALKTELEGKIALKADQSALDELAEAAATKEALKAEEDRAKGEEARIEGLVTAEAERAAGVEADLDERLEKVEAFFVGAAEDEGEGESLKNALDTLVEIQDYINTDGAAADEMIKDIAANTKAIEDMDAAYKEADKTLQGNIDALSDVVDTKAAQADLEELEGRMDDAEEALAKKAEQTALDQEIADREAADEQVLKDAKDYTDAEVAKDRERLTALEGADTALEGRVKANEDAIAAINNEETGILKQAKDYADGLIEAEVEARNEAIATAKGEAIADAETKDATVLENAKAHAEEKDAENLEAAKTYTNEEIAKIDLSGITTNAGNITALQEDVAELQAVQHEEISVEEINSLFPEE